MYLFLFVPVLAFSFPRLSYFSSLILATGVGLFFDLSSADYPFGFYALIYWLTTVFLYRYYLYFADKPIGFFCFTAFFSFTLTSLHSLLAPFFRSSLPLTWHSVATDFLFLPLIDAAVGLFSFFTLPFLWHVGKKRVIHFLFFFKPSKRKRVL